jgi:hypothetical protein
MSDQPWVVAAPFPLSVRPEFVLGAASPLWGYFAAAIVSGTTWWWMTRWMQGADLLSSAKPDTPARPSATRLVLVSENTALVPVGGEAAPIAPAVLEGELLEGPEQGAEVAAAPVASPKPASRRRAKDSEA